MANNYREGEVMRQERIDELKQIYRDMLLDNVIPFWMKYSPDWKNGGYYHYLDRDGSILSPDKSVWIQGRGTWIFSRLYNVLEKRSDWLNLAKLGYDFLIKHCFDTDGRMFFKVTNDGRPLRKRRYWFSETFAAIGCAEYAKASGDSDALEKADRIFDLILKLYRNPGLREPKVYPQTRQTKSHSETMILIATAQVMREVKNDDSYNEVIDDCISELFNSFVKYDEKALLENVGPNGEILDSLPEGRCINPGHAIETSWFLLTEALYRNDQDLIKKALDILDWSLERGWDNEYGGLLYFTDLQGKPPEQMEWDLKLWWPHSEALYALLLAHHITGSEKYETWYEKVHKWTFEHFVDQEYGEWFGYLHRDGTVSLPVKGNVWKGPFHIPRYLLYSLKLLEKMEGTK